ncbi:hypothetical protein H4S08_004760 [Coemansia sp. RSA 1365]|nr:hypothetical protein H4S08_004760 [Coemansia sp. RSA 1365]
MVRMVKSALHKMKMQSLTEWDFHLPLVQLALNLRTHRGIRMSPGQAMFGREMLPPHVLLAPEVELTSEFAGPFVIERINRGGAIILRQDVENDGEIPPAQNFAPHELIHLEQAPTAPEGSYEVDYIITYKKSRHGPVFKVHWRGYSKTEDSWVSLKDFADETLPQAYAKTVEKVADREYLLRVLSVSK